MTLQETDFLLFNSIEYTSKADVCKTFVIPPHVVAKVVVDTNKYLSEMKKLFQRLEFDIYGTLEQRNLSGFIGEIFSNVFVLNVPGFLVNPHADGRPDLIDVSTPEAQDYLWLKCGTKLQNGEFIPDKSKLAPFEYGGLEVKSTIGNLRSGADELLQKKSGVNNFSVGLPRIDYISGITYWGHHTSCENLIGLYYDYSEVLGGAPQIYAVMHACLDCEIDWNVVSIGKPGSKKTSNTSLTKSGQTKIMRSPVVVSRDPEYFNKLKKMGLEI